ncbi:MAG: hypothetical protein KAI66_19365 [Lentisphaeria bacterium]|nr:hypothetical protein [Lentisphaeria bacterium]
MKRQIRWTERLEDRRKLEVRVSFQGSKIKWQFKHPDMGVWDYDSPPTAEQWEMLSQKLRDLYQRGHVALDKQILLVEKERNG